MAKAVETDIGHCTIASKINGTPISKLNSILAVANLLAHNNIRQISYCGLNNRYSDNLTPLGVTYILLAMVHLLPVKKLDPEFPAVFVPFLLIELGFLFRF